ncbi:MAG: 6-phosphofructokinase, partial [Candidatus Cloacimonetes bacterium]|nr:6-phosphofructokinase [Candidatus Cloacimonadota bacterium]
MKKLKGKMLIAQGGGPTAVINQSLVGAILKAREFNEITSIYGAVHGVRGIINEDFLDLSNIPKENLEKIAQTPSSALLSTRDKPDDKYCNEIFKVLQAHNIRYFFYIGGNDSADTCKAISEYAKNSNYNLRTIHIPKTIDNDLKVTDHCPGFGSAAKFVSQAFAGVNLDNRSIPGLYIGVVMGRHAGFLTASSMLAKKYEDDGPHLIYFPEKVFSLENFIKDVNLAYKKFGRCMIAVSEGIMDENGTPIATKLTQKVERDSHGNIQLSGTGALGDLLANQIRSNLTHIKRVRADTFGYLQRSFLGVVSDVDAKEAREVGMKASQFACELGKDGSVAIKRIGEYQVEYFLTPLDTVAKFTKP